jgi:hypothetical protein
MLFEVSSMSPGLSAMVNLNLKASSCSWLSRVVCRQDRITCCHVRIRVARHELLLRLAPFLNSRLVIENADHIAVADERPVLRNAHNANDGIQRREWIRNDGAPGGRSRQRAEQRALPCVRRVNVSTMETFARSFSSS